MARSSAWCVWTCVAFKGAKILSHPAILEALHGIQWSLCCHAKDEENCIIHLHWKKNERTWECWNSTNGSAEIRWFFFWVTVLCNTCQSYLFSSILGLFPDQTTTSQWQKETSWVKSRSEKKSKQQKVQHSYHPHISKCIYPPGD